MRKIEFDVHLQRILLKVDRASMYFSQEVRVPLLSNNVINKSLEYSIFDCIEGNRGKIPLKDILIKHSNRKNCRSSEKRFFNPN